MNIDLSAIKDFRITERQAAAVPGGDLQCSEPCGVGDAGSASWGGSSGAAPPSNFGVITSTRATMRQIQLALKYNF